MSQAFQIFPGEHVPGPPYIFAPNSAGWKPRKNPASVPELTGGLQSLSKHKAPARCPWAEVVKKNYGELTPDRDLTAQTVSRIFPRAATINCARGPALCKMVPANGSASPQFPNMAFLTISESRTQSPDYNPNRPRNMAATLWSAVMFLGVSLLLVLVSLPLFFLLYLYHVHKVYDHIPGPKRNHFVWGHLKEIERIQREGSSSTFDKYLEYAIEYGPVMLIWFLHKPIVIVTSPELVKEVTVIANLPKDPWVYKNSIGFPLGERLMGRALPCAIDHTAWQRRRSTLNPAFHKTFLKELIPQFNSCCDVFLAKLSRLADGKTEVVMLEEFNRATLDVIGKVRVDFLGRIQFDFSLLRVSSLLYRSIQNLRKT